MGYMLTHHGAMVHTVISVGQGFISAAKDADFQKEKRGKAVPPSGSGPFCHKHVAPLVVCSWYALPLSASFAAKECLM